MATTEKSSLKDAILDQISEMAFFNHFDSAELDIIAGHLSLRDIEENEEVFKEGDPGNYMCFVARGKLNVLKEVDIKKKAIINTISRGKSLGEMAMVDSCPRSATVVGATKTELVIMGRQAFDVILEKNPRVGVKLLQGIARLLSLHLRQASGRLADRIATR